MCSVNSAVGAEMFAGPARGALHDPNTAALSSRCFRAGLDEWTYDDRKSDEHVMRLTSHSERRVEEMPMTEANAFDGLHGSAEGDRAVRDPSRSRRFVKS